MYMTDERPTGVAAAEAAIHLRLTGSALDRKLTALRALATQTGPLIAALDPDVYAEHVAEECFVDASRLRSDQESTLTLTLNLSQVPTAP